MNVLIYLQGFLVLFALTFSCGSQAKSTDVQQIKCATTHYPPFAIYNQQNGTFVGQDLDILHAVGEKLNWQFKVHNLPWGRVIAEIEKDHYECFFAMAYHAHRAEHVDYTQYPLHVTRYGVFYKNTNHKVATKNLAGLSVALLRGIDLTAPVLKMYGLEEAQLVYLDSNKAMLAMVELDRVDAAITNIDVGKYVLSSMEELQNFTSFEVEGYSLPVYLVFKKGKHDLDKINAVMSSLFPINTLL